jgi:hypothetical protein
MKFTPEVLTTEELLNNYSLILKELKERKVIRTHNNPTGDYAEWLVASRLGLALQANSKAGYDAEDSSGIKYQIKSRRSTEHNTSTQLSAFRNLEKHDFDYLIVVLFDEMFNVKLVMKLPHEIIGNYARFSKHVNAHLVNFDRNIMNDPLVENLTPLFLDKEVLDSTKVKQVSISEVNYLKAKLGENMDKKLIESVGKECFVKYFELFRDETNSTADLIELLIRNEGYTENACRTRISKSRKIINDGFAREVLQDISGSTKLSYKVTASARDLLKKYF